MTRLFLKSEKEIIPHFCNKFTLKRQQEDSTIQPATVRLTNHAHKFLKRHKHMNRLSLWHSISHLKTHLDFLEFIFVKKKPNKNKNQQAMLLKKNNKKPPTKIKEKSRQHSKNYQIKTLLIWSTTSPLDLPPYHKHTIIHVFTQITSLILWVLIRKSVIPTCMRLRYPR